MVFQDPLSSLTLIYTIGFQIVEALTAHGAMSEKEAAKRAVELLGIVGIPNPSCASRASPRVLGRDAPARMIAMAIANDPDVIIADEPTTALDDDPGAGARRAQGRPA